MKLRLRHNSIRLRLSKSEVQQLRDQWRIEERIEFGAGTPPLVYALVSSTEAVEMHAEWSGQVLTVEAPRELVDDWCGSNEVGMTGEQPAGSLALKILVEKDFQCLENRGEEDADAFPHPHAGAAC